MLILIHEIQVTRGVLTKDECFNACFVFLSFKNRSRSLIRISGHKTILLRRNHRYENIHFCLLEESYSFESFSAFLAFVFNQKVNKNNIGSWGSTRRLVMLEMACALKISRCCCFCRLKCFCLKRWQGETLFSGQYSENNRRARAVLHS